MTLYWFSFSDEKDGFKGVAVVKAATPKLALHKTHTLEINPGGKAAVFELEDGAVPDDCLDRLLHKAELVERDLGVFACHT